MKISLPNNQRNMPPIREVEDVLRVVCQKAGLNEETISFAIAGGGRSVQFPHIGVKLLSVSSNALGVPMYVGCKSEAVEGHLVCSEMKRGMDLHCKLLGAFGNSKMHIVDERRIRNARNTTLSNGESSSAQSTATGTTQHPELTVVPELEHRGDTDEKVDPSGANEPPLEKPAAKSELQPFVEKGGSPRSLAHNLGNLHLAVIAFATQFGENEPFSFAEFEHVLTEVGVQCDSARPYVRVFTDAGLLVRLNPNKVPARYALAESCSQIANETDEKHALQLLAKRLQKSEKTKPQDEDEQQKQQLPPLGLLEQVKLLRQRVDEYDRLRKSMENKSLELEKLKARKFDDEERDIKGQILSHEKRLAELRNGLEDIVRMRDRIPKIQREIEEMRKRISDGSFAQAAEELAKLKSLLG